ncbi:hypothetical protein MRB53_037757 [Persea americana]|nr:hypothetical protein MRB53_037757 [Persea americana]
MATERCESDRHNPATSDLRGYACTSSVSFRHRHKVLSCYRLIDQMPWKTLTLCRHLDEHSVCRYKASAAYSKWVDLPSSLWSRLLFVNGVAFSLRTCTQLVVNSREIIIFILATTLTTYDFSPLKADRTEQKRRAGLQTTKSIVCQNLDTYVIVHVRPALVSTRASKADCLFSLETFLSGSIIGQSSFVR